MGIGRGAETSKPCCYDLGSSSRRIIPLKALPLILLAAASAAVPLLAHHSVAAKFDKTATLILRGVVSRIEWMNPHARFWLDTTEDNGLANWEFELPAPNALIRSQGFQRGFIKVGDQITVTLWRAKDASRVAHALSVTLPSGNVIEFPREWGPIVLPAAAVKPF